MGDLHLGLFDVRSRTLKREIEASLWAQSAAWSPDGRELAVTGDSMAVWSNGAHRGLAMLPTENWNGGAMAARCRAILNTVDGGTRCSPAAVSIGKTHLRSKSEYAGHDAAVLSPDGKRLACSQRYANSSRTRQAASRSGMSRRRNAWCRPNPRQYIRALAWSPDGALLAAGTEDGGRRSMSRDRKTPRRVARRKAPIRPIAFSPDGKTIAAGYGGNGNGFVRLYDVKGLKASGHPRVPGVRRQVKKMESPQATPRPLTPALSRREREHGADASVNPKSQIENPKSAQADPEPKRTAHGVCLLP